MRTTIYLVRHAQAHSNVNPLSSGQEDSLTSEGQVQAHKVAGFFKNINISGLYTSGTLRTKQTAEAIGQIKSLDYEVLDFSHERKVKYQNDFNYENIEDSHGFLSRISEAKQFLENLPEGRFVFVSHAIFIKALLASILTKELNTEAISEQISSSLVIDNASITEVMFNHDKAAWRVMSVNKSVI